MVFTIVGYPRDVREVTLGPDGTLAGAKAGTVLVDMTTSEPALAIEIDQAAQAKEVHAVDAPVSGGDVGARSPAIDHDRRRKRGRRRASAPLRNDGQNDCPPRTRRRGPAHQDGQPDLDRLQHDRRLRGFALCVQGGARPELVLQSVSSGAAGSWSLSNLAPRVIAGNFEPGFFVEHFLKDMGIALAESRRMKLSLPGLALAQQLYRAVEAQGYGAQRHAGTVMLALAQSLGSRLETVGSHNRESQPPGP